MNQILSDEEVWDCYQHSHGNTEYTKAKAFGRMLQIKIIAKLREQQEPNQPTDGERIAAVGGVIKENLTVEFGSVMAVSAMLIKHENECIKLVNKYRDGLIAANEYAESLREEIAKLEHPAPIPEGWQPISTAPKDGTRVLIKGDCTVVAGWQECVPGVMGWAIVNAAWMSGDVAKYWTSLPKLPMPAARSEE